jgi:predicted DNA-binding ribbon-helix-helix protein
MRFLSTPLRPFSIPVRNVVIAGKRMSVRLEPAMWEALKAIAQEQGTSLDALATEVDRRRMGGSLTSAIRVYCVAFYRSKAVPANAPPTNGGRWSEDPGTEPSARSSDEPAQGPRRS